MVRRDVLKLLAAGALTASCAFTREAPAAISELRYRPEQDARLRFVRWRNLNQSDDDQWMANTRKFTEQTGVPVQVENISLEEVWAKAAVSANVGAGPDIVMGAGGQAQLPTTAGSHRARRLSRGQVRRLV
jgi:multiple sugar transport system substrate-binding protein